MARTLSLSGALFVLGALALARPEPAHGQAKQKQADVHYEQGKAYYRAEAFELAIQEFLAGYALAPRAAVLFNIGLIYQDKLKNGPKAIEYFKKYLDLGNAATEAVEARARIAGIERQLETDRLARENEAKRKAEAEREAAEAERRRAAAAEAERQRQAELARAPAPPPAPPVGDQPGADVARRAEVEPEPASPERARNLKLTGLVAGGAGVALAGLGVVFALQASALTNEIESATGQWTPALMEKDADRKTKSTVAVVSLIAGGVAMAGGAAAYYLGWQEQKRVDEQGGTALRRLPTVALLPDGGATLLWSGRF